MPAGGVKKKANVISTEGEIQKVIIKLYKISLSGNDIVY
jgi:hypothetical protein